MKSKILLITSIAAMSILSANSFAEMEMGDKNSDFMQMDKMMSKAENSKDKKKRQEYMHDHMGMMMNQMNSMGNMMNSSKGMNSGDMNNMSMMNQRINKMQKMMEQMMRQQKIMIEDIE